MASVDQSNRFIFVNAPTLRAGPRDARRQLRSQLMRRVYLEKHPIPVQLKKMIHEIEEETKGNNESPRFRRKESPAVRTSTKTGRNQLQAQSTGGGQGGQGGQVKSRRRSSAGSKTSIPRTSPVPLVQNSALSPFWIPEKTRQTPNSTLFVEHYYRCFIPTMRCSQEWSKLLLSSYEECVAVPVLFNAICLSGSIHYDRLLRLHNNCPPQSLELEQTHYRDSVSRELRRVLPRLVHGTPIFEAILLSICLMAIHDPQGEVVRPGFTPEYNPFSHPLQDLGGLHLYGSGVRSFHWCAIQTLIKQNGGFDTLKHREIQWALTCLSLKYAMNTDTKPIYPVVDHTGNHLQDSPPLKILHIERTPGHSRPKGFDVLRQFQIRESIVHTFLDVGDLAEGIQMLIPQRNDPVTRDRIADARNAVQYRFLKLPRLNEPLSAILDFSDNEVDAGSASIDLAVYKSCWLAGSIFTISVTFPLATGRDFRRNLAPQLQAAITDCSPVAGRKDVARMLLWCLMIGGIAAEDLDPALRSWYVAQFKEQCEMLHVTTWPAAQELMRSFAWTEIACDHGGSKIWAAASELNE